MSTNRRSFLAAIVPAGIALVAAPAAWPHHTPPKQPSPAQENPNPNFPRNPNQPDSGAPPLDPKKILKANQEKIQEDIQRLYTLATQLKDQVEKTDNTAVLNLALLQKARSRKASPPNPQPSKGLVAPPSRRHPTSVQ